MHFCENCGNMYYIELNKNKTFQINSEAPKYFAKAIKKVGGKILQISSDYVFDGNKKTPYKVNDQMNPKTIYGESKFLAEKSISELLYKSNQFLILRLEKDQTLV